MTCINVNHLTVFISIMNKHKTRQLLKQKPEVVFKVIQ